MAQAGYTPIQLYHSTTASAVPSAGNLANGEPALNITDGKLYYKNNSGVVTLLASADGASGNVVGPASSTDNALVRFDTTTGKLVQNSVGILDDSGNLTGIAALTTSGALTLNGGTANGVAYLNGSKVLTTGSALTFDGTNFLLASGGRIRNIPTTTTANALFQSSNDGGGFYTGIEDSTGSLFTGAAYAGLVWHTGNRPIAFGVNNAEQMRLTSTGLGIGTSSPSQRLTVSTSASDVASFISSDTNADIYLKASGTTLGNTRLRATGGDLVFITGLNDRMRLDSSGNLGLGVTPSAWSASFRAMQVGGRSVLYQDSGSATLLANNIYNDGTNRYIASAASSIYLQGSGAHQWFIAPSGTAGNAISFTQAMTLTAAGSLLVGTTADEGRLTVAEASTGIGISFLSSNGNYAGRIGTTNEAGTTNGLDINATRGDGKILFKTSNTERARIDSSGNLLVGRTSLGTAIGVSAGIAQASSGWSINNGSNMASFGLDRISFNSGQYYVLNQNSAGVILTNGSTSWGAQSDERTKDIIEPISNAAEKVATLRAVIGKYKNDEDGTRRSFLIAQDVQAVLPEAVSASDDEIGTLNLRYSEVIPLLTAAIQEQQALIQTLTARVAALESN